MYSINKEKARLRLLQEGEFTENEIDRFLSGFPQIDERLGQIVETWIKTGEIPNFEIENLKLKDVMANRQSHFLAAIRDLNLLFDDSLSGTDFKNLVQWLSRPQFVE